MKVRIVQSPTDPQFYVVQFKQWWHLFWRTYSVSLPEQQAIAMGKRLLNPLIVEIKP